MDSFIRTDQIGRLRFTADQRRSLLDAFWNSGQSVSRFAAQHGIKYTTFANRVQKHRRLNGGYPPVAAPDGENVFPLQLAEVECPDGPPATTPLEVRLPGGASIAIHGDAQLGLAVELLRQLARPC